MIMQCLTFFNHRPEDLLLSFPITRISNDNLYLWAFGRNRAISWKWMCTYDDVRCFLYHNYIAIHEKKGYLVMTWCLNHRPAVKTPLCSRWPICIMFVVAVFKIYFPMNKVTITYVWISRCIWYELDIKFIRNRYCWYCKL